MRGHSGGSNSIPPHALSDVEGSGPDLSCAPIHNKLNAIRLISGPATSAPEVRFRLLLIALIATWRGESFRHHTPGADRGNRGGALGSCQSHDAAGIGEPCAALGLTDPRAARRRGARCLRPGRPGAVDV